MEIIIKCSDDVRGGTNIYGEPIEELVRCKDCKHNPKYTNDYMYGGCVFCCEDDFYSGTPDDDFFCGFGERKESE